MLPESARPYWEQQQQINAAAVAVVARAWFTSGGDMARWLALLPFVMSTVTRAQAAAALTATKYVRDVLVDLSIDTAALATVDPAPLIGLSGAGLPLRELYANLPNQLALNTATAAAKLGEDMTITGEVTRSKVGPVIYRDAMDATAVQLQTSVQTTLSDTGRSVESLEVAVRPGVGYVRMLNPPSCKRCVILAGKSYRWNSGFKRHERCDCRHIPSVESTAGDMRVDPKKYFDSLTAEAQDGTFTKAGAQAIRDGANVSQVVNADSGMRVAQVVYGQNLKITTQGVTKRGQAGRAIRARGRSPATTPRLMPSSIYQIADDRADAIRLLRMNGYIAENSPGVIDLDTLARSA